MRKKRRSEAAGPCIFFRQLCDTMGAWLLNVFLASLLLSLTVHVTFQLGVASQWQQADDPTSTSTVSGPRGLGNDNYIHVAAVPRHPGLRRSDLLLKAAAARAAAVCSARIAMLCWTAWNFAIGRPN